MTNISLGQTIDGSLSSTDTNNPKRLGSFSDDYTLTGLPNWQQVQVNLDSTAIDSYLQLINASTGEVIAFNDDLINGRKNSQLSFTVFPGVNYAIRATSLNANETGNYTFKTTSLGTVSSIIATQDGKVGTVDGTSGNFAQIATSNLNFSDIALSNSGQLFGITFRDLYKIDPNIGSASLIGAFGLGPLNALEFANNILYAAGGSKLYTINSSNGEATLVADLGSNFNSSGDLVFDATNNRFLATSTGTTSDSLFSVSLTGQATKIGDIGFKNVFGISSTIGGFIGFTEDKKYILIDSITGKGTLSKNVTGVSGAIGGASPSVRPATPTPTPPTPTPPTPTPPTPTPPTPTPPTPTPPTPTPTPLTPTPTPPTVVTPTPTPPTVVTPTPTPPTVVSPTPTPPTVVTPTPTPPAVVTPPLLTIPISTQTSTVPPSQIPAPNASGEVDLDPLKLKVINGQFTYNEKTKRYEASGTIQIGRKDGTFPLIVVQQGKVEYDQFTVNVDGITSSLIGPNSIKTAPLFKGKFDIDVKTATASSIEEDKQFTNQFKIAGQDIEFNSLSLNSNVIALGALFKLPSNAGGASVVLDKSDALLITPTEVKLGKSQKRSLPNFPNTFLLGNLFQANASNLSIEYVAPENKLKLQGKFQVQQFADLSDSKPYSITLDYSGKDNFIEIKDGKTEFKGEASFNNVKLIPNVLEITKGKMTQDTANQDLRGEANILLFPAKNKVELIAGLGFKNQPPSGLSLLTLGLDKLNKPLGTSGLFLQRVSGRYELAKSDGRDIPEFTIGAGLTGGPEIPVTLPPGLGGSFEGSLVNIDADYTVSPNGLRGKGKLKLIDDKVALFEGVHTRDWNKGFYEVKGDLSAIDGLFKAQVGVKLTSNFDLNVSANGSLSVPNFVPLIGGKQLGSADFMLKFTNNNDRSDDFVAGWSTFTETPFGIETKVTAGFRVFFDGKTEWLTRELPKTSSFTIAPGTKWLVMGADWESANSNVPVQVKAPNGTIFNESDFAATGKIAIANQFTDSTTKSVIVLNPEPGIWDLKVANPSGLGNVEYKAFRDSAAPTVQVTASSKDVSGQNVTINYNALDADSTAKVSLFYDTDNQGFDGILIKDGLEEKDGAGNFIWNTQGIATGDYYVYAMAMDENNAPVFSYAPLPIKVTESADLSVIKTADRDTAIPGSNVTYTVAVTNNGTDNAKGAILTETLPEGAKFVSANITPTKQSGNELTFDLGDVAKGQISTVSITITAPTTGNITGTSSITSKTYDPDISNDFDFASTTVTNDGTESVTDNVVATPTPTPTRPPLRQVLGTPENDNLVGIDAADSIAGFAGDDTLAGLGGDDIIYGNKGNDIITGNSGNDNIFGGRGNDLILGGADNDRLKGNEGDDTLSGDLGRDILIGGPGSDTFVLPKNAAVTGDFLPDAILDFQLGVDKIGLTEGLTQANLLLNFEEGNTFIKIAGSTQILGVVVGVTPSQLSGSFVSINLPVI
ncbi:hypothetical protein [Tychonema sp. BBK16]|uniref:hypothetical protein n=1 Tax=Tychonema sp. BBK16 TaxID=2699888 RepID=UPI001F398E43|nr:hypothetical protein [Tychonema sp. BBK16]MCF6373556.1 hypothetical protein [Tychonema sp. BBK16]